MMCLARRCGLAIFFLAALANIGCASRVRPIVRGTHPSSQKLLVATKADLIRRVREAYESVQSFSATVDLTASVGSVYKNEFKDYTDVTSYIDFRKPGNIRVVGLLPVVRTTAFHMVSNGDEFKVLLATKGRFIEGRNDEPGASANKLENIRPQTFLSAMLVKPVDTVNELSFMADDTTETVAFYQLGVVRKVGEEIFLHRRITFDRFNLQITEQREYDEAGSIISLTRYDDFKVYHNVRFPSRIQITRPKDEYGLVLQVIKMDINNPVPDSRFILARPEGTELQVIGASGPAAPK